MSSLGHRMMLACVGAVALGSAACSASPCANMCAFNTECAPLNAERALTRPGVLPICEWKDESAAQEACNTACGSSFDGLEEVDQGRVERCGQCLASEGLEHCYASACTDECRGAFDHLDIGAEEQADNLDCGNLPGGAGGTGGGAGGTGGTGGGAAGTGGSAGTGGAGGTAGTGGASGAGGTGGTGG